MAGRRQSARRRSTEGIRPEPPLAQVHLTAAAIDAIGADRLASVDAPPDPLLPYVDHPDTKGIGLHACLGPDHLVGSEARRERRDASWDLQMEVGLYYLYAICARPRIRARLDETPRRVTSVAYEYETTDGWTQLAVPDPEYTEGVAFASSDDGGATLTLGSGDSALRVPAWLLVDGMWTNHAPRPAPLDFTVLYVGKSQGKKRDSSALLRLGSHSTYQLILEDYQAPSMRHNELFVFLGAGSAMELLRVAEQGTTIDTEDGIVEVQHIRSQFPRRDRIDLTEAAIIRHFAPLYNTQHVASDLNQTAVAKKLRKLGVDTATIVFGMGPPFWSFFRSEETESLAMHAFQITLRNEIAPT